MAWLFSIIILAVLVVWAAFCRWLTAGPRGDDVLGGLAYHAARFYARSVHQLRIVGAERIPPIAARDAAGLRSPGPLIVVCNHTAGVDPLLVQAALPFEPRWMMAADMQMPFFRRLWEWARVISVQRVGKGGGAGRDAKSIREAIAHVQHGGVLGVFPEGGIERPPRRLRPFHPGVGLIVARTGAPVLPIWIDGTPQTRRAWGSLWFPSFSRLSVGPMLRPTGTPEEITAGIRAWFRDVSGWPDAT